MHYGEPLDDDNFIKLIRLAFEKGIRTFVTADVYGTGEADTLLGRALEGISRDHYCLVGAVGHDFYQGEREGSKGFPVSPVPLCASRARLQVTSARRPRNRSRVVAPIASTFFCSTIPMTPATRATPSGREWRS